MPKLAFGTMIELGGHIELEGFDDIDPGKLVVIKKIVGSYARQMTDSNEDFEKLNLCLEDKGDCVCLKATGVCAGKEIVKDIEDKNLFYGLDKVLGSLLSAVR